MNCTYTSQGFLYCPTVKKISNKNTEYEYNNKQDKIYNYSNRDIIEGFALKSQSGIATNDSRFPLWINQAPFNTTCSNCTIASCTNKEQCNLKCDCSRCKDNKTVTKHVSQNISIKKPYYYCGDIDGYNTSSCTDAQYSALKCKVYPEVLAETRSENYATIKGETIKGETTSENYAAVKGENFGSISGQTYAENR